MNEKAIAWFYTPPLEWANIDICGYFPCTGPKNALFRFEKTSFAGTITPLNTDADWQIIPNNPQMSDFIPSCRSMAGDWNAYYCTNNDLATLTWESLDDDKLTRVIAPIEIVGMNISSSNKINGYMDHIWDGFYPSLKRLNRYNSIITTGKDIWTQIFYFGAPPLKQKFTLRSLD